MTGAFGGDGRFVLTNREADLGTGLCLSRLDEGESQPRKTGPEEGFEIRYRMIWPE